MLIPISSLPCMFRMEYYYHLSPSGPWGYPLDLLYLQLFIATTLILNAIKRGLFAFPSLLNPTHAVTISLTHRTPNAMMQQHRPPCEAMPRKSQSSLNSSPPTLVDFSSPVSSFVQLISHASITISDTMSMRHIL